MKKNIGNDASPGSAGALDIVDGYTEKIDNATTDGLLGVDNSLSYRAEEIEKHIHNHEKWFGLANSVSGETHVADRMTIADNPFQLASGNNTFGLWVQILGSDDTPVQAGMVKQDTHRLMVVATNSTSSYVIQIVSGESADIAAKILAEDFTEVPYISLSNNNDSGISDAMSVRILVGVKVWARVRCIGADGPTIDFYYGLHEYVG